MTEQVADPPLLRLEEARSRMLEGIAPLPQEPVHLDDALWCVLAEPVDTDRSLPPWDNSAMDGFAVRAADVVGASIAQPAVLRVVGEVAAGHPPTATVTEGTTLRVLTGGIVPPGSDAIVPVEDTDAPRGVAELPDRVAVHRAAALGAHIRLAGSDVRSGERVLHPGQSLTPARLALAAAVGRSSVQVHRRPRVAVIATGDELVALGTAPGPAGIPDSNSTSLAAQVRASGGDATALGIAADRFDDVVGMLRAGIASADMVIVSGGVSVGAHDVVKAAFESVGSLDLWRVAVQPGKPLAFGRAAGGVLLFGLPGNPVSTFVTFELFVRPVLRRLAGHRDLGGRISVRAEVLEPLTKSPGRRAFLRVVLTPAADVVTGWRATLAGSQGSHVISALAEANGLAIIPEEVDSLPAGSVVDVMVLDQGGS